LPTPLDFSRDFQHAVDVQSGAAGAAVTATLAGVSNRTTWVLGFHLTSGLIAAAVGGAVFIGPVLDEATNTSKTLTYGFLFLTTGLVEVVTLPEPLPAPGPGQQVQLSIGAIAGGPALAVTLFGLVS
jgi:hypothetical protein